MDHVLAAVGDNVSQSVGIRTPSLQVHLELIIYRATVTSCIPRLVSPFIIIQSAKLYILYVKPKFHYLRDLPGEAKTSHWIIGSNGKIFTRDPGQQALEWQKQYGDVYTFWDYLGVSLYPVSSYIQLDTQRKRPNSEKRSRWFLLRVSR